MTSSAALFFEPQPEGGIPLAWLAAASDFLAEAGLPIHEFALALLRGDSHGQRNYGEQRDFLVEQLGRGNVNILGLYSNAGKDHDLVMDWQGLAYLDLRRGRCFLGVPQDQGRSLSAVLRTAYDLNKSFLDFLYGFSYHYPALWVPDFYAAGILSGPSDYSDAGLDYGTRVARWMDELREQRRHLRGYFRSVYPVNLLSEVHLDAPMGKRKTLRTAGIGRLTPLDGGRWLWEVNDKERAKALDALSRSGLILSA